MVKKIIFKIKSIDKNILNISKKGIAFSLLFFLLATLILFNYTYVNASSMEFYYIGIALLRLSITCISGFLAGAIFFDKIKKDLLL